MVSESVPEPQADVHPVHGDPGVVKDLVTWHVTCHEAHHWPRGNGSCPNYRNKSANSGQRSPVLLELKPEFGSDSDTNKISGGNFGRGCKILLSSRKISNFKLAPIFVIWLMLHKGKFGWKSLEISWHVSRASLYIRYWSMAHTVGTCVLRSWPKPTWCYQWIMNVDTNFECLSRYSIKLQMLSKEKS